MTISPVSVGAAVTPTVIKTYISHYANRSSRRQKPTAHISYDEGLHLIRSFLEYASHHTVEDLQAFTAQWVPSPSWVRTEDTAIPQEYITKAADSITTQLGPRGVEEVGGTKWWQWRRKNVDLKGEWIEMRADFNARKQLGEKSRRVMLYVHGGAYFFGSVDEHRYQMQRHARKLKARVFAPRYRLAPQFPFPCGLLDCLAAYLYLLTLHDKTEIILAGDSAGGGMVVSMLCLLRDQGLPLPAGAILISPWVDLTHSFPSVAEDNQFDYIPPYGFMQKPSVSWPPPNDEEMDAIREGAGHDLLHKRNRLEKKDAAREASQGFAVHDIAVQDETPPSGTTSGSTVVAGDTLSVPTIQRPRAKSDTPGPHRHLQIEIEGKLIELKDQIQMYATNQLISHPLVSPVLQPSLGGLPPLLVLTGGGEMLRDEQIYLAHKAAHPDKYPLGAEYRARYDPNDEILHKYKPTPVQLQVWEDLCHVAPTLSFTRPAKFMYRSVAQFGAWALARAQNSNIEIMDDDEISVISSDSDRSERRNAKFKPGQGSVEAVGKAGDPLPAFKHHMIRQRVNRHGNISPLEDASQLVALQMGASAVGVIKVGPVKKWMDAKLEWDTRYARIKRKVQKRRIADLIKAGAHPFDGEDPPPSALAGRRKDEDMMMRKPKKSYWLAIWSGWGSKHDEDTIKNEKDVYYDEPKKTDDQTNGAEVNAEKKEDSTSRSRQKSDAQDRSRSRQRKRLTIVSDAGQVEGDDRIVPVVPVVAADHGDSDAYEHQDVRSTARQDTGESTHLTPMFLPKFKNAPHLKSDSKDMSDASSIRTGHSVMIPDNLSTRAVFSAAGVLKEKSPSNEGERAGTGTIHANITQGLAPTVDHYNYRDSLPKTDDQRSTFGGNESPTSRRSVERLMDHQIDMDGASFVGTENSTGPTRNSLNPQSGHLRSISTMAVVQHEGVVDEVDDNTTERHVGGGVTPTQQLQGPASTSETVTVVEGGEVKPDRPVLYDRSDLVFKTAMEYM